MGGGKLQSILLQEFQVNTDDGLRSQALYIPVAVVRAGLVGPAANKVSSCVD